MPRACDVHTQFYAGTQKAQSGFLSKGNGSTLRFLAIFLDVTVKTSVAVRIAFVLKAT